MTVMSFLFSQKKNFEIFCNISPKKSITKNRDLKIRLTFKISSEKKMIILLSKKETIFKTVCPDLCFKISHDDFVLKNFKKIQNTFKKMYSKQSI